MPKGAVFAIVSDGAGSAEFGAYGAWLVCRTLKVQFREWLGKHDGFPDDKEVVDWIDGLRDRIWKLAEERRSERKKYAATLASLLIADGEILTLQIGDSAVVGRRGADWETICRPENGEYVSTTYFVTDDPAPRLKITRQPSNHNAFALFSDGVGELALSSADHDAHPRFFGPMMRPIDDSRGSGRLRTLSEQLRSYLAGPAVCSRTDDDKTLVLLSRV